MALQLSDRVTPSAEQVTQPLRHPWVDTAGRLSWPALDAWSPARSRLADLVGNAVSGLSGHAARTGNGPAPSHAGGLFRTVGGSRAGRGFLGCFFAVPRGRRH